mmetsp:Transcript_148893/g.478344  ORF Transcript_148893/g.478344 Transcript_148893/m.478344 type:complete len:227 (-) Transcript_148893:1388-2068(-)
MAQLAELCSSPSEQFSAIQDDSRVVFSSSHPRSIRDSNEQRRRWHIRIGAQTKLTTTVPSPREDQGVRTPRQHQTMLEPDRKHLDFQGCSHLHDLQQPWSDLIRHVFSKSGLPVLRAAPHPNVGFVFTRDHSTRMHAPAMDAEDPGLRIVCTLFLRLVLQLLGILRGRKLCDPSPKVEGHPAVEVCAPQLEWLGLIAHQFHFWGASAKPQATITAGAPRIELAVLL